MYFYEKIAKKKNNPAVPITAGALGAGITGGTLYGANRLADSRVKSLSGNAKLLVDQIRKATKVMELPEEAKKQVLNVMRGKESPKTLNVAYLTSVDSRKPMRTAGIWKMLDSVNPRRLNPKDWRQRQGLIENASKHLQRSTAGYRRNIDLRNMYKKVTRIVSKKQFYIPAILGAGLITGLSAHAIQNRHNSAK